MRLKLVYAKGKTLSKDREGEGKGEKEEIANFNWEVGSECGELSWAWTFFLAAEPCWKPNMWAIRHWDWIIDAQAAFPNPERVSCQMTSFFHAGLFPPTPNLSGGAPKPRNASICSLQTNIGSDQKARGTG